MVAGLDIPQRVEKASADEVLQKSLNKTKAEMLKKVAELEANKVGQLEPVAKETEDGAEAT